MLLTLAKSFDQSKAKPKILFLANGGPSDSYRNKGSRRRRRTAFPPLKTFLVTFLVTKKLQGLFQNLKLSAVMFGF